MSATQSSASPAAQSTIPSAPVVNPWIRAIKPYVPGSSSAPGMVTPVKLSSNENPWGASPRVLAELARPHAVHRYPDGSARALRAKIAALHGLDPDRIVCGTGSDELLQLLPFLYCDHGDSLVHVRNSFVVYHLSARRAGATPIEAADRAFTADVDAMLAAVRADTRIVYLANPNNPTGTMLDSGEIARLHAGLRPDILLVIDQAYIEYVGPGDPDGGVKLATTCSNVLVTRTFSKIYGLGGMRVGWATGHADLIAELNRVRTPFPISVPALAAAEAALDDQPFIADCRRRNAEQRALMANGIACLSNKGLGYVPSVANFVLMTCPPKGPLAATKLHKALMEKGYITRHLPDPDLADALRVSVGTEAETAGFLAALGAIADAA